MPDEKSQKQKLLEEFEKDNGTDPVQRRAWLAGWQAMESECHRLLIRVPPSPKTPERPRK